ncbi:MAG: ATP-binding protein [Selenomonadaceae bacterium]|nr:ATP-binding protein [Selenomonadaceae bacterium]
MIIKELKLKNFRCFEELTINFSIPYTVLIGINGSGKSSILDGIIIDGFVSLSQRDARKGFAYINNIKLQESDAKIKTVIAGSTINKESCYPLGDRRIFYGAIVILDS